ncbi:cancer/testis antigen 47B [Oryx dammah]|uniref:cancer/testis antigen 47B n=1 Tax=Oryx dammah TaxID=59534 RepID=UPI001A9B099C|nr:cancer/testis antigen 47B [Oryx dammah]
MSTTGDGNLAPEGQEGLAAVAEAQAGAREGVDRSSEPRRGDSMPEAEAGGVVGASGGQREAALEGGNADEESDIGPAEAGEEEEQAEGVNRMVDARHFPMAGFRLTFLNLMHSMLNRLHNNHVLIRSNDDHVPVWHQTRLRSSNRSLATVAEFSEVQVPSDGPGEGPAEEAPAQEVEQAEEAQEAEEAEEAEEAKEASLWETATEESESSLWEMAQEPAAAEKAAECQDENSKEEAQATKSEGKEKKDNKKQEEPEKDLDPAKDRPRKSRYLCIALKITQLFPGIYQFCFCFLILGVN